MSWRRRSLPFRRSASAFSTSSSTFSGPDIIPHSLPSITVETSQQEEGEDRWSRLLPELLGDILRRVDEEGEQWPARKDVVSCACVCRRWREVAISLVRPPHVCRNITFPFSLKQPGPKDRPLQCFIRRDKKSRTFYLYLGLIDTLADQGKFLMAARRARHGACTEYIISLAADDLSQASNAYLGKLRSDFLGTNFSIYDTRAPFVGARQSSSRASRRFSSKQISPQVPARSFVVGQVSYKFNLLKSKGPRRMVCTLQCPWMKQAIMDEGDSPKSTDSHGTSMTNQSIVLKNKAPRWHEQLQCWCLNFHGRVTVASVKNFQLAAAADPSKPEQRGDEDAVLLQFGKVGDDMFTMDYRQPLSAFQSFAICLTSFGTKLACE